MAAMSATDDKAVLVAIPTVLKMADLNPDIIQAMTRGSFFTRYHATVKRMDARDVNAGCLSLLDRLARVSNSSDFAVFLPMLLRLMHERSGLTPAAIIVFATFSSHRFMAEKFNRSELVKYFESIQKVPAFANVSAVFLANVAKAARAGAPEPASSKRRRTAPARFARRQT